MRLIGALGVGGILAAVVGAVITQSWGGLSDGARDLVGGSALVAYVEPLDEPRPGPGNEWAVESSLADRFSGATDDDVGAMLVAHEATPIGSVTYGVTLENRWSETITLTRIRAVILHSSSPLSAAFIYANFGGGTTEGPVNLWFDLDASDLDARTVTNDEHIDERFLDHNGLTLESGEKLRFRLTGVTARSYVEWDIEVHFIVGGEARTITIAPAGETLRVTALSAHYSEYYRWVPGEISQSSASDVCEPACPTPGTPS